MSIKCFLPIHLEDKKVILSVNGLKHMYQLDIWNVPELDHLIHVWVELVREYWYINIKHVTIFYNIFYMKPVWFEQLNVITTLRHKIWYWWDKEAVQISTNQYRFLIEQLFSNDCLLSPMPGSGIYVIHVCTSTRYSIVILYSNTTWTLELSTRRHDIGYKVMFSIQIPMATMISFGIL